MRNHPREALNFIPVMERFSMFVLLQNRSHGAMQRFSMFGLQPACHEICSIPTKVYMTVTSLCESLTEEYICCKTSGNRKRKRRLTSFVKRNVDQICDPAGYRS
jgi:hypothetical protein